MYTRETFDRQRAAAKSAEQRASLPLAVVSVSLGIAQLLIIRWIDAHFEKGSGLTLEVGMFLTYVAIVGAFGWRFGRIRRAARLQCPQCEVPLQGMPESVASATGRCEACGGRVIEEGSASAPR